MSSSSHREIYSLIDQKVNLSLLLGSPLVYIQRGFTGITSNTYQQMVLDDAILASSLFLSPIGAEVRPRSHPVSAPTTAADALGDR